MSAVPELVQIQQKVDEQPWRGLPPKIASVLRPSSPAVAEEMLQAVITTVPAYARPLEGEFGEGIRAGVRQALDHFLAEKRRRVLGGERRGARARSGSEEPEDGDVGVVRLVMRDARAYAPVQSIHTPLAYPPLRDTARCAYFGPESFSSHKEPP